MKKDTKTDVPRSLDGLVGCQCTLAQRLCGDGCQFCNPELGAELKWNAEADDFNQWDNLGKDEKDELIEKFKASNENNEGRIAPKETTDEK